MEGRTERDLRRDIRFVRISLGLQAVLLLALGVVLMAVAISFSNVRPCPTHSVDCRDWSGLAPVSAVTGTAALVAATLLGLAALRLERERRWWTVALVVNGVLALLLSPIALAALNPVAVGYEVFVLSVMWVLMRPEVRASVAPPKS